MPVIIRRSFCMLDVFFFACSVTDLCHQKLKRIALIALEDAARRSTEAKEFWTPNEGSVVKRLSTSSKTYIVNLLPIPQADHEI